MIDTWDEARETFNDALDGNGDMTVAGLTFAPSKILATLDPIAYRCGLLDWLDAEGIDSDALIGE